MDTNPHQRELSSTQVFDRQRLSELVQYSIMPLKLLKWSLPWNRQEQRGRQPGVPAPCFNYASVSESVICGKPERINLLKGK